MQRVLAVRDPLAWLVLGGVAATSLLVLVSLVFGSLERDFTVAAASLGPAVMSPFSALVVLLAVAACVGLAPRSPQAATISLTGLILVVASGAIGIVLSLIGLAAAGSGGPSTAVGFLRTLASFTVVVAAVVVLLRLWQTATEPAASEPSTSVLGQAGAPALGSQPGGSQLTAPQPGAASWQPQPHAGAVWGSAHAAATGSQVSGWGGAPGAPSGWTPASLPPQAPPAGPSQPAAAPQADVQEYTRIAPGVPSGPGGAAIPGPPPGPQSGPQSGPYPGR